MNEYIELIQIVDYIDNKRDNNDFVNLSENKTPLRKSIDTLLQLFENGKLNFEKYGPDLFYIYKLKRNKILGTLNDKKWIQQNLVLHLGKSWNKEVAERNVKINLSEIYKKCLKISDNIFKQSDENEYLEDEDYKLPNRFIVILLSAFRESIYLGDVNNKYEDDAEKIQSIIDSLENEEEYTSSEDSSSGENMMDFLGTAFNGVGEVFKGIKSGNDGKTADAIASIFEKTMNQVPEEQRNILKGGVRDATESIVNGNYNIDSLTDIFKNVVTPLMATQNVDPPDGVTVNETDDEQKISIPGIFGQKLLDKLDSI